MIRLALLRHGPTAWNRAGRIQGRSDIPLDPEGAAELGGLALPPEWQDAALCASPLARAADTARHLTGRDPHLVPELVEMDWGAWEGQRGRDLAADPDSGFRHIEDWGWDYRPPDGESPADLRARLGPWLAGLDRDTVAICHIGVMRVLLAMATGWDFAGPAPVAVKRRRLYVLHVGAGRLALAGDPVRLIPRAAAPCG